MMQILPNRVLMPNWCETWCLYEAKIRDRTKLCYVSPTERSWV